MSPRGKISIHGEKLLLFFFVFLTAGTNIGVDYLHTTFKKLISQCVMRASPLVQDVNMAENMKERKKKRKRKLKHIHFSRFAYERKQRSTDKNLSDGRQSQRRGIENTENTENTGGLELSARQNKSACTTCGGVGS